MGLIGMYFKYPWGSLGFLGVKRHAAEWNFKLRNIMRTFTESKWAAVNGKWRFLYVVNACSLCCYYFALEKDVIHHLNRLESPLEISPVILEKKTKMWKVQISFRGVTINTAIHWCMRGFMTCVSYQMCIMIW